MPERRTAQLTLKLSKEDYDKLQEAKKYTILQPGIFLRLLLHEVFETMDMSGKISFEFDIRKEYDSRRYKSITFLADEEDYAKVIRIQKATPMSQPCILNYLLMPKIREVVREKKWEGKI